MSLTYKQSVSDNFNFVLPGIHSNRKDGAFPIEDFRAYIDSKLKRWNSDLGFNNDDVLKC